MSPRAIAKRQAWPLGSAYRRKALLLVPSWLAMMPPLVVSVLAQVLMVKLLRVSTALVVLVTVEAVPLKAA